jgi:hypothetical protein
MSVAITAQVPAAASSPATASPQATQGPGATSDQGLADFFAKARVDAGVQIQEATNSVASSGEMLGKLREFVEKAHQADAQNRATRARQRAAAADSETDLASLDTLGSFGSLSSLAQLNPLGQSGSFGKLAALNGFGSPALHPGPASASLGPGPGLQMKGLGQAMVDRMTNDLMDSAIQQMWTRVVAHATSSITKSVMTLVKGQ